MSARTFVQLQIFGYNQQTVDKMQCKRIIRNEFQENNYYYPYLFLNEKKYRVIEDRIKILDSTMKRALSSYKHFCVEE